MVPVSVVIIAKSTADIIEGCIENARKITDDVIIIYNGPEEDTLHAATNSGCRVYKKTWEGYGANKNKGADEARYNWILSIDADEVPDDGLISAIQNLNFKDKNVVYDIKFRSHFGGKLIRFGSWGRDHHIRLFNRELVKWSETLIHEKLTLPKYVRKKKIKGHIHHYSAKGAGEFDLKCSYYAKLSAEKYFRDGKKAGIVKLYFSPIFGFLKNYIFSLGFLDGRAGWVIAATIMKNTRRKYLFLSQIENLPVNQTELVKNDLVVEYKTA
ncbi:glycosyltransferase family 2 protein [Mucilaginibacter xinganensis]|uniref:Glycosyltransferase 2-like domain-containing protein n=1 Tax=Mucilaginibacter xinganensis TaxID=1234841 RepID=A0A223NZ76_9SPHI|nr:glycosyltransferase family 2 protein [Mucilaginibacter xinganensis]ASU35165.1 hypothetical protein MuYL_3280 [Mucilaginibacter xinganensis]